MNYFNNVVIDPVAVKESVATIHNEIHGITEFEGFDDFDGIIKFMSGIVTMQEDIMSHVIAGFTRSSPVVSGKIEDIIAINNSNNKAIEEMIEIIDAREVAMNESHFGTMAMCSPEEVAERMADTKAMVA